MSVFKDKTILKILDYYKNLWALSYTSAVNHWDLETYMPALGAASRGEALGRLATIRQKMFLDSDFVNLIHKASAQGGLTDYEKGVVRVLTRSLKFYEKIPGEFIENFEKLTNTATVVWREAKQKDDFKLFEPYLKKIFDENRKMAEYLGYKDSPYDALLDQYEEQLNCSTVELFFNEIRQPLKDLLNKILKAKPARQSLALQALAGGYDRQKMKALNEKVLKYLWSDYGKNFRLDESSHPFTTSFGNKDTRITTWYHDTDFARSLLAVIHEFGHALYDLQSADELEMTPISGGSSLVIHESQSRYWENHIGRSKEFISRFKKDFDDLFANKQFASSSVQQYYQYFNKVRPSLLRVEADEVTYHFHIMLRFEIEKGIIEQKLKVKDLPEIWNSKMKEYLSVVPKRASDGVLQDIHWSGGSVGYFPTYSLGTFLSANWIGHDKKWLKDHIHKYGSTYTLDKLLEKNKLTFEPKINLDYLNKKYADIYHFAINNQQ